MSEETPIIRARDFFNVPRKARNGTLRNITEAVAEATVWDETDVRQLDSVLRALVVDAIAGPTTLGELRALYKSLMVVVRVMSWVDKPLRNRIDTWRDWATLVDTRASQLQNKADPPERIRYLPHTIFTVDNNLRFSQLLKPGCDIVEPAREMRWLPRVPPQQDAAPRDRVKFVNCTAQEIRILDASGTMRVLPLSGFVTETVPKRIAPKTILPRMAVEVVDGITIVEADFPGEVLNLPPPEEGTYYIVSFLCEETLRRLGRTDDILVLGTSPWDNPIRDPKGVLVGVTRLKRLVRV